MVRSFTYPIQVYPHHTDYAGVVWHGAYVNWMEEVRVAFLDHQGLPYAEITAQDCDLMVVALNLRYHRAAKMGESLLWYATLHPLQGVRCIWDYELRSLDHTLLYVTAQVTIVPVNRKTGKLMRRWPPDLVSILCPPA
ncbi:MAG: acyl-CoA thioesterase [Prochlorotrichaceae cyanobacterium]